MNSIGYEAWLRYPQLAEDQQEAFRRHCGCIAATETDASEVIAAAAAELSQGLGRLLGVTPVACSSCDSNSNSNSGCIAIGTFGGSNAAVKQVFGDVGVQPDTGAEGFAIRYDARSGIIAIGAEQPAGVLYGVFHLLRLIATGISIDGLDVVERPVNAIRMINQWDNMDGSVERGYAGQSIFYENDRFKPDLGRVEDYARLLASTGLNAITINNVNVHHHETYLITERFLPDVTRIAAIFRRYAIKLYLSVNFASPIETGELTTADPLDADVKAWWKAKADELYQAIPDFGGFLVKADSENRPGPFTYGRDHADGSNMLAEALLPHGGLVIWRCFVYNCKQDWRDRKTDRARAAYDHFKPLDGRFMDNVILQIKNGPMDFQVREPVSPLFGALPSTNCMIEFQIAQEYTGQARHLCYLVPQWKEVLDFDTYAKGEGSYVREVVDGSLFGYKHSGFAAVSNIGDDAYWTGHPLAQANLYGYGRLAWSPERSADAIAEEWTRLTFGSDERVVRTVVSMLMDSWSIYESYTAPLGVGWMVSPNHHYGPDVDGYEYSKWGTYHFSDYKGMGVDRTLATGTGYAGQYREPNASIYGTLESCPDELLLFFHHVPYTHVLHSGKTVIQHIYDTHFEGVERADGLLQRWNELEGRVDAETFKRAADRFAEQAEHAREWRDRINTYYLRKSGISDALGRTIY
mgnify:CR=1 FL=1